MKLINFIGNSSAIVIIGTILIFGILEKKNVPVGRIVTEDAGRMYVEKGDSYYVLSERLAGNNLVNLQEFSDIGVTMGGLIADLHLAFKECEQEENFWNNSLLTEMNGWIREIFERNDWKYVSREVFENIVEELAKYYLEKFGDGGLRYFLEQQIIANEINKIKTA